MRGREIEKGGGEGNSSETGEGGMEKRAAS